MKSTIIDLNSNNPYENVATEYDYYNNIKEDEIIFLLWQNESCVVMGRNQNIFRELDLEYITKNKISPVRRFTGGGCVYHDLGNLNFTFISSQKNKDLDLWIKILLNALELSDIQAKKEGRNDLLCNGKKFSGMAWLEDEEKFMIHGTLMVNLDLSVLGKCLTPDYSKFIGKGIKSVKSRVCNLSDINKEITVTQLKENLVKSFRTFYPNTIIEKQKESTNKQKISQAIQKEEWIYGKNEKAELQKTYFVDNKPINLDIWIENDIINKLEIYSDSLNLRAIDELKNSLLHKKYLEVDINQIIKNIFN